MTLESLIVLLVVGLIAGWLASMVIAVRGVNLLGYILIGVVGAFIGGFLFSAVGIAAYGFIGSIVSAFVGSVVLLFIVKLIRK